ncbi:hypothetical protein DFH07DRAFT_974789 [Mycena maculata]|uniref:Uncharacterized protein n=1 Tax=Mycena maculata TaxID=230809 RepID=A0AAD7MEW4_9AGAR|nr:hypothetical protein DFH07DRAFT_974789 [Mycena maculata]
MEIPALPPLPALSRPARVIWPHAGGTAAVPVRKTRFAAASHPIPPSAVLRAQYGAGGWDEWWWGHCTMCLGWPGAHKRPRSCPPRKNTKSPPPAALHPPSAVLRAVYGSCTGTGHPQDAYGLAQSAHATQQLRALRKTRICRIPPSPAVGHPAGAIWPVRGGRAAVELPRDVYGLGRQCASGAAPAPLRKIQLASPRPPPAVCRIPRALLPVDLAQAAVATPLDVWALAWSALALRQLRASRRHRIVAASRPIPPSAVLRAQVQRRWGFLAAPRKLRASGKHRITASRPISPSAVQPARPGPAAVELPRDACRLERSTWAA